MTHLMKLFKTIVTILFLGLITSVQAQTANQKDFVKKFSFDIVHPIDAPPKFPHLFSRERAEFPSRLKFPVIKYFPA